MVADGVIGPIPRFVPGDGLSLRCYEWWPRFFAEGRDVPADGYAARRDGHDIARIHGFPLPLPTAHTLSGTGCPLPPIVLLHGISETARTWDNVAAILARKRRVIAFDARGHGSSGWSAEEAYAPDHHFADVTLALDALGVRGCTLVGFSMGGAVATICAAARPDLIARLVIVDAYPAPELSPGSLWIARNLAALYDAGIGLPGDFDPAIARRMRDDLAAGAARRLDLWPLWEALTVPARVVRGALSDVLTADMAARMVARQPHARLVTLPGVGHQIPLQRPHELAAVLLE